MSLVYQGIPIPNSASAGTSSNRRPGLYIGGKDDAKNYDKLSKYWNVMYILNVTPSKQVGIVAGVPNYFESDNKFKYKRIPIYDNESSASELLHSADAIVSFIATGLCHGSVLVHCHHGISRSTTAVLFYLMRYVLIEFVDVFCCQYCFPSSVYLYAYDLIVFLSLCQFFYHVFVYNV